MPLTSYCLFLFPLLLGLLVLQVREPKINLVYRYKDGGGMSRNNPTRKRHEIKGPKTPSNFNPSAFEHALLSVCLTDSVLSTSNSLCLDLSLAPHNGERTVLCMCLRTFFSVPALIASSNYF